jgi:hypothetical protein
MDKRTLNEWLKEFGYKWQDGQEHLYKALMDRGTAQLQIDQLVSQGAVIRG